MEWSIRKCGGILFCVLTMLSAKAQKAFEMKPISERFLLYITYHDIDGNPFPANALFLITDPGIVMIDCPWDTSQTTKLIDSAEHLYKRKVIACIATHFHEDRTGSLNILKGRGIKTYSSHQTFDLCKKRNEPQAEFYFENDTTFCFGSFKIETYYPGKGHSPDNIVIWFEQDRILYGGCFIKSTESGTLGNMSDADAPAWLASVKRVQSRYPKPALVIPGHQDFKGSECLAHTRKLLEKQVRKNK